jgi:hypothetical protein
MSAIQFPNSPTVGDRITASGVVYEWDGTKWLAIRELVASGVSFSNTAGGLTGEDVQAAIDQIIPSGGKVGKARLPAGSILQVVQGTASTEVVVNTTTYTDTGLAATITPSSNTSKILVMIDQSMYVYRATDNALAGVRLLRGSTVIHDSRANPGEPSELGFVIAGSGATLIVFSWRYNLMILDAPNTSNAITYKTQGRPRTSSNGEAVVFQESGDSVNATSRIVLMEVAG